MPMLKANQVPQLVCRRTCLTRAPTGAHAVKVTFYNPQVDDWTPELVEVEVTSPISRCPSVTLCLPTLPNPPQATAKKEAQILFFVIDR